VVKSCVSYLPDSEIKTMLNIVYDHYCRTPGNIHEHLPVLRDRARECGSVVELGAGTLVATWALLAGLSQSAAKQKSYVGIEVRECDDPLTLRVAHLCAHHHDIGFAFTVDKNEFKMNPPCDLLFIDALHTYPHLTAELEHFHHNVAKYIIMHDTSAPWGHQDEALTTPEQRQLYPLCVDYRKQGLWPAIEDFVQRHPEWYVGERRLNCHGLTTLQRRPKVLTSTSSSD
jgi:hypothetical protein